MVKWLVFLIACQGHNPAFCPQGTADDGTCTDAGGTCFGTDPYAVCPTSLPVTPLMLSNIDTTTGCDEVLPIGCVVAGTDVTINSHITVRGSRPLVIFATGTITVTMMGILDAAGSTTAAGAGADLACAPDATAPTTKNGNGGGGGGGSFGTRGSDGGDGGGGATGGLASSAVVPATLEGGCDGDAGANGGAGTAGMRGFAGGGVYLLAEQQLSIMGTIVASGGGGGGGHAPKGGAGGGGSGGMIVLSAPMISVSPATQILADGGGGGGGGANMNGNDGGQPLGGKGNNNDDGGDGANGANAAKAGTSSSDGGGAGGGGAGVIHVVGGSVAGAHVSPTPS
jgi:hypothetical protein